MIDDCGPECEETLRQIERFLDGELETSIRIQVEEHLSDCHPCTARAEFHRHLKIVIAQKAAQASVPPEVAERVRRMIHQLDRPE
jgi:mycothiol system anti-sigma-R factor